MAVPSNTPKYICKSCKNKIPITDLDGLFRDELKNYLTAPDKVAEYIQRAGQTIGERREMLASLKRELEKVRQDVAKAFDLYKTNALTAQQFKEWFQPLDTRKAAIEEERARIEAEIDLLNLDNLSSEQVMTDAQSLYDRWATLDRVEKRKLVELLVKRITIGKDDVSIELCYLPSFEMMTEGQRANTAASSSAHSRSRPRSTTSIPP
jgi:site-specific DNA recombinase